MYGMNPTYMIITGVCMALSWLAGKMLQSKFKKFSALPVPMTGKDIARKMLAENGITDVQVISTPGQLTDHYNPGTKTVNLSEVVYNEANVAAAAVAAHEVGHAVQHATSYAFLQMRSKLVPVVNISTKMSRWVIMAGVALASTGNVTVFGIGIILMAASSVFSLITLPVEFNASARALNWLEGSGLSGVYHGQAKTALFWAAMTYCVAALASLGQLFYFVMRFLAMRARAQR